METSTQASPPLWINVLPIVVIAGVVLVALHFVARRKGTTLSSLLASGRSVRYCLLLVGAVLGYIGSYFGQPGVMRAFASLGDYIGNAREVLIPPKSGALGEHFSRSVCLTGWVGVILGVVLIGGVIFYVDSTKKRPSQ